MNTSVHHEMICPLRVNVRIAEELLSLVEDEKIKRMAQTLLYSSKLLLLNANDLLDKEGLSRGSFIPVFEQDLIVESV